MLLCTCMLELTGNAGMNGQRGVHVPSGLRGSSAVEGDTYSHARTHLGVSQFQLQQFIHREV